MKYYLGMTLPQSHDFSIAIFNDSGELLFLGEEERFNRVKHNNTVRMTFKALHYFLNTNNIKKEDIQQVVVATNTDKFGEVSILKRALRENGIRVDNIAYVEHHLSHAASSFFTSGFNEAAIITIDGIGDDCSWGIFYGEDNHIVKKDSQMAPNSLGYLYLIVTIWLGLGGFGDEGKTMGLAPYGEPKYVDLFWKHIIGYDKGNNRIILHKDIIENFYNIEPLIKVLGKRRNKHDTITQYHKDVAASLQKVTEEIIVNLVSYACSLTGSKNVCLAGGVALNSVANGKLLGALNISKLYVSPLASDLGNSVGAVYETISRTKKVKHINQISAYMGAEIDDKQIENAAMEWNIPYVKLENPEKEAAQSIAKGKIIGWIQGKAEIGPRALGNRSILGNALLPNIKDMINRKIKYREMWRPFAPSVLEEDKELFFKNCEVGNQYMTTVVNFKEEYKDVFKSVVHIDGTGRVQYVSKKLNSRYHSLLTELKKLTGYGVVLNTSFNLAGEPIVNSAEDAIKDFLKSDMDELFIRDYRFKKEDIYESKAPVARINAMYANIKNPIIIFFNSLNSMDDSYSYYNFIRETFINFKMYSLEKSNSLLDQNILHYDAKVGLNDLENDCIIINLNYKQLCTRVAVINEIKKKYDNKTIYIANSCYDLVDIATVSKELKMYSLLTETMSMDERDK